MYRSQPDLEAFAAAFSECRSPVCYNGNIFRSESRDTVCRAAPGLERLMLGRGAVANPALFRILRGGSPLSREELSDFLFRLEDAYSASGLGTGYTLGRMKEVWYYVNHMFPDAFRPLRQIQKARSLDEYRTAVSRFFAERHLDPQTAFPG